MHVDPVKGVTFYNREQQLLLLKKRTIGLRKGYRQNISFLGLPLVGKTSLLLQFREKLKAENIITVYLEVRQESFERFSQRFIGALLYFFLEKKDKVSEGSFDLLAERAKEYIPRTLETIVNIRKTIKKKRREQVFSALFDLIPQLQEETKQLCVIILDEFQRLETLKVKNCFVIFGQKIMTQKETMYVITSSAVSRGREILENDLALLFGNFEISYLKPFIGTVSSKYITECLEPVQIDDAHKKFLINLTGGHPFYLNKICTKLKEIAREREWKRIKQSGISDVIVTELFSADSFIYQYLVKLLCTSLNERYADVDLKILSAIADGHRKSSHIANLVDKSSAQITKRLERFVAKDILCKGGKLYAFCDPLFRFWFRYVFRLREECYEPVSKRGVEKFSKQLDKIISDFLVNIRESHQTRIKKLFSLFHNEVISFGERNYRLPSFAEVKEKSLGGDGFALQASTGKRCWVVEGRYILVTEKDVRVLAEGMRWRGKKVARKILIPLGGLETDAKLLAHEEGIWIWNLADVNFLLNLYDKSEIIL